MLLAVKAKKAKKRIKVLTSFRDLGLSEKHNQLFLRLVFQFVLIYILEFNMISFSFVAFILELQSSVFSFVRPSLLIFSLHQRYKINKCCLSVFSALIYDEYYVIL